MEKKGEGELEEGESWEVGRRKREGGREREEERGRKREGGREREER